MTSISLPTAPHHCVRDIRKFLEENTEFYIMGTGLFAQRQRQWLESIGKKVTGFLGHPSTLPLVKSPLRHRVYFSSLVDIVKFLDLCEEQCDVLSERYIGDHFYGLPVLDPDSIDWEAIRVLVCLEYRPIDAVSWLRKRGLRSYEHYIAFPEMANWVDTPWENAVGLPFYEYWKAHQAEYESAVDSFDDDSSRGFFAKVIRFRAKALDFESIQTEDEPQSFDAWGSAVANYFETKDHLAARKMGGIVSLIPRKWRRLVEYAFPSRLSRGTLHRVAWILSSRMFDHLVETNKESERIIIDCGAFEGETSAAIQRLLPSSEIYAFEPLTNAFDRLTELSKLNPGIHAIKMGTWDSSGISSLRIAGEGSRVGSAAEVDNPGEQEIRLISIDEFVENKKIGRVDIIKMNIEGAELPSLKGARRTIDSFHPLLSICAEHQPSDMWQIPTYLKATHADYSLSFKHLGPHIWSSYVLARQKRV